MAADEFLGLGWQLPVTLDAHGHIAMASDGPAAIRQSIWTILSTAPGERVMRPDFGCGIHDMVFGSQRRRDRQRRGRGGARGAGRWEPRIDVLDVYAAADPADRRRLLVEINYQIRSTNSRFNLVYPFYLD